MKNILLVQAAIKQEIAAIDRVYHRLHMPDQMHLKDKYDEIVGPLKDRLAFTKKLVDLELYARSKGIEI